MRARCGRGWAALAAESGNWPEARDGTAVALAQLPLLTDHGLSADDRRHHLAQLAGLGPAAAYAQVADAPRWRRHARVRAAWQSLEAGRGVLVAQALETRTDLTILNRVHPDLADRLDELLRRLNRPYETADTVLSAGVSPPDAHAATRARQAADQQRDDAASLARLYDQIRGLPGFERFGLPPTIEQMQAATGDGNVVAVLATPFGCGALIMNRKAVDYLPLPRLSEADAHARTVQFLSAVYGLDDATDTPPDSGTVFDVLEWAWDAITGPVLAHLGHTRTPERPLSGWPRVWWLPTSVLTLLPLHAAGYHREPAAKQPRVVLDLVVSSYLPTMRVLVEARKPRQPNPHALVVGVNKPTYAQASLPPLAFAEAEAEAVHNRLQPEEPVLLGPAATHDHVNKQLPTAGWAHFACHAAADNTDPARGFLALHDQRLEVRELGQLTLTNAHLAFLSACTTATAAAELLDEPIHLASAFLIAGYQHAIGSLWTINDALARVIAERTYQQILVQQRAPAEALHHTIRAMRANQDAANRPDLWAAHIHFGP